MFLYPLFCLSDSVFIGFMGFLFFPRFYSNFRDQSTLTRSLHAIILTDSSAKFLRIWGSSAKFLSTCWYNVWVSLVVQMVKNHLQYRRPRFNPWVGKIPWRREWQPLDSPMPGESHGQRSLVGYSPWDQKELDMTEHFVFFLNFCRIW